MKYVHRFAVKYVHSFADILFLKMCLSRIDESEKIFALRGR